MIKKQLEAYSLLRKEYINILLQILCLSNILSRFKDLEVLTVETSLIQTCLFTQNFQTQSFPLQHYKNISFLHWIILVIETCILPLEQIEECKSLILESEADMMAVCFSILQELHIMGHWNLSNYLINFWKKKSWRTMIQLITILNLSYRNELFNCDRSESWSILNKFHI
jgi:hypothetical protein